MCSFGGGGRGGGGNNNGFQQQQLAQAAQQQAMMERQLAEARAARLEQERLLKIQQNETTVNQWESNRRAQEALDAQKAQQKETELNRIETNNRYTTDRRGRASLRIDPTASINTAESGTINVVN